MPSSTSARPTWSRRPGARARSPSRPTWPAVEPTSSWVATRNSWRARRWIPRPQASPAPRSIRRSSQIAFANFKPQCDAEREDVLAAGGLYILGTERHESRRIDNQLRGRVRPPGRSWRLVLLHVPRRRPDAHLRGRAHLGPDGASGHGGRRPHRTPAHQSLHRTRAEAGRRPQLRHPQEPAGIRRRHEPAAQDHLCLADGRCSRAAMPPC